MKKKIIALLLGIMTTALVALADVPSSLPISSAEDLQAYAWSQVKYIGVNGWASSSIRATGNEETSELVTYPSEHGYVDVGEVLNIIKVQQLELSVLYPSDTINVGTYLYSTNWDISFYGWTASGINPPQNGVSRNVLNLQLRMNPSQTIPFDGAVNYYIVERDLNGNTIRFYSSEEWDVGNGWIRFPAYFSAVKAGELVITKQDGTQVAYGLGGGGGNRISPTQVQIGIGSVSVLGTRTFRGTNVVVIEVTRQEDDQNFNPLAQVIVTGTHPVTVYFTGIRPGSRVEPGMPTVMELAEAVEIWQYGQTSRHGMQYKIVPPAYNAPVTLSPGVYWARCGYASGWPFANPFPLPVDDGKGKDGSTDSDPALLQRGARYIR